MNGRLRNTGHSISSRFLERPILVLLLFAVTALFLLTTSLVVVDAHRHHHGHQHHGEGRQRSPYEILGVSRTATEVEIKKAYKALALKWHPDRNPGNEEANQKFAEISNAYEILGDPEKKREYDTYGSVGQQQQHGGYRHFHSSHDFFSNVFREFFGEQWQQQKQEDPLRVTSVKTISEEDYAALMEGTHSMSHRVWVIFIYTFTSTNSRRVIKLVNELEADMGQSIFVRKLEFVYTPSGGGNVKLPRGMDVFPGLVLISPSYGAEMYPFNVYTSDLMKRWIADRLHPSPSKLITSFGPSPSQSSLNEFLNAPTGRGVSAIVFSQRAEIAINEALVAWECKDFIKIGHYRVRSAQQLSSLSGLVELHAHQLPAMVIVDRTMPSKQTMRLITNLDKEKFLGALKTEGLAFGRFPVIRSQSALWDMCHDRTCLLYSRNSSTTAVPVPLRDQIEQELPLDPILSKHKLRLAQVENHEQLCAFFNESLSSSFLFAIVEVSTQHFESMALDNDYTDLNDVKQWIETKMTRGLHSRYSGDIPVERSSAIPLLKFLTPLMRSITKMVNIGVDHLLEAPLLISLMYCFLAVYFMLWVFFWTFSPSPPPPPKKPTSSTSQQLQQRPTHSYNPPARGQ